LIKNLPHQQGVALAQAFNPEGKPLTTSASPPLTTNQFDPTAGTEKTPAKTTPGPILLTEQKQVEPQQQKKQKQPRT